MALDILLFIANNPDKSTARDVCQFRGMKPGIVSFHVDRLAAAGLLERRPVPGDRRKTQLVCTEAAADTIRRGRELQKRFAEALLSGQFHSGDSLVLTVRENNLAIAPLVR